MYNGQSICKENILFRECTAVTHIIIQKLQQLLIFKCNFPIHESRLESYFHESLTVCKSLIWRYCVIHYHLFGSWKKHLIGFDLNQMLKYKQHGHNSKQRTNSSSKKASIKLGTGAIIWKSDFSVGHNPKSVIHWLHV